MMIKLTRFECVDCGKLKQAAMVERDGLQIIECPRCGEGSGASAVMTSDASGSVITLTNDEVLIDVTPEAQK